MKSQNSLGKNKKNNPGVVFSRSIAGYNYDNPFRYLHCIMYYVLINIYTIN
jgi:hypothetical protein